MNVLPFKKRLEIFNHLTNGNGIRQTATLCEVRPSTVTALLRQLGPGCQRLHDRLMINLSPPAIEMDEMWSFVQTRRQNLKPGASLEPDH